MNSDSSTTNVQTEGVAKNLESDNQQALTMLQKSDLKMIRALSDLIYLLIRKDVITITDLPPTAQVKLMNRANARQELGGLEQLLGNGDRIFQLMQTVCRPDKCSTIRLYKGVSRRQSYHNGVDSPNNCPTAPSIPDSCNIISSPSVSTRSVVGDESVLRVASHDTSINKRLSFSSSILWIQLLSIFGQAGPHHNR